MAKKAAPKNRSFTQGRVVWIMGFVADNGLAESLLDAQNRGLRIHSVNLSNLPCEYGGQIYTAIAVLRDPPTNPESEGTA